MIQGVGQNANGRITVVLGLSAIDCTELMFGKLLVAHGGDIGLDYDVMLIGGSSEEQITDRLFHVGAIDNRTLRGKSADDVVRQAKEGPDAAH